MLKFTHEIYLFISFFLPTISPPVGILKTVFPKEGFLFYLFGA